MNTETKEIIVIGGGLMGSAAAWHLSRNGKKVTLLEQQGPDYTYGSSLGKTRIARSLGPQKDIFSYFHNRSVQETEKLIDFLNSKEGSSAHRMEEVYTTSPVTYIYYESQQAKIHELLDNQKDPVTYAASVKEAKDIFGMAVPDSARVFRESKPNSGTMNPEALIKKLHAAVELSGSEIQYHRNVSRIQQKESHYEIESLDTQTGAQEILRGKQVVSATGPYTGRLLRETAPVFEQLITPKKVALAFVKMDPQTYLGLGQNQQDRIVASYPLIDFTPELTFAMIDSFDQDGVPILKVGRHLVRKDIVDLDSVWKQPLTDEEENYGIRSMHKYLRMLNIAVSENELDCVDSYSCVYSLTASETPLVTYRPDKHNQKDPSFVVMGGMSGVGAKGAMTYGLVASNLLLQQPEDSEMYLQAADALDIDRLRDDKGNYQVGADQTSAWFIS